MKILNNLCVSTGEMFICYAIKVSSRKLFAERVPKIYDSTSRSLHSVLLAGVQESN